MSDMNSIAGEWLAARNIIAEFFKEMAPWMLLDVRERNAAAILARLAHHIPPLLVSSADDTSQGLRDRLAAIRGILETAVCVEEPDKGVILLSDHGPTHTEQRGDREVVVYDHEYFSPLGDALIAAWEKAQTSGP